MAHKLDDILDAILRDQAVVMAYVQEMVTGDWLQLDLTMPQLKALFAIWHQSEVAVGTLGQALMIGLPAASALIDRLVQQGLTERSEDPTDRRRMVIRLTPAGERLVTRLREGGRERLRAWIGQLDESDLTALAKGLRGLAAIASAELAKTKHMSIHQQLAQHLAASTPAKKRAGKKHTKKQGDKHA